jgi:hypothetical protein
MSKLFLIRLGTCISVIVNWSVTKKTNKITSESQSQKLARMLSQSQAVAMC